MVQKATVVYQIKVTLDGSRPSIWRRFRVPGNTTLLDLHRILQVVMGWEDYHLHQFIVADVIYGDPAMDEWGEWGIEAEGRYRLSQIVPGEGFRFRYEYDFGDSWEHTLLVEKIAPAEDGAHYPVCLKGKRACPPEDVGGVWGYETLLEAISDPEHPEHEEYLEWVNENFDPDAFDLEAVNAELQLRRRVRGSEARSALSSQEDPAVDDLGSLVATWAHKLPDDQRTQAESLALRRDVVALLAYLRDNRITGTQATGNLPLKAVREISALFVDPPVLDTAIGDRVYRLRSEADVWPLYFRHVLASAGGWVEGGPGRRWRLTPFGEDFLTTPAPLQVWLMLAAWWTQVNWAIAAPFRIAGDELPARFCELALDHLCELPQGEPVPFAPFASRLIEDSGLIWPIEDQKRARSILQAVVERTVIDPLIVFEVLAADYGPHELLGGQYHQLSTFKVTPFGSRLLRSLRPLTE